MPHDDRPPHRPTPPPVPAPRPVLARTLDARECATQAAMDVCEEARMNTLALATVDTFRNGIHHMDAATLFRSLPENSVHCIVTSPPYYGLRDYGADGQIGLEDTPDQYVARLVVLFELARRALRDDGVLWLNLGDTYANDGKWGGSTGGKHSNGLHGDTSIGRMKQHTGLKPKDLIGIPWRVAFALQAAGWWLRSDIIWEKGNPMPESVRDRPTKSHEYIFLFTKSPRYFYDSDAIREGVTEPGVVQRSNVPNKSLVLFDDFGLQKTSPERASVAPSIFTGSASVLFEVSVKLAASILDITDFKHNLGLLALYAEIGKQSTNKGTRRFVSNIPVMRSATTQATRFANGDITPKQFLSELYRLWVTLPDSDHFKKAWGFAFRDIGLIDTNGNATVGVNNASEISEINGAEFSHGNPLSSDRILREQYTTSHTSSLGRNKRSVWHVNTQPSSFQHFAMFPQALIEPMILAGCPTRGVVVDPFMGSGTTALVAQRLQRDFIGCDVNAEYVALARDRVRYHGDDKRMMDEQAAGVQQIAMFTDPSARQLALMGDTA